MAAKPFLGLRGNKLSAVVVLVAGAEFLLFGYDQGVMGGLLTLPSFTACFPELCTTHACTQNMTQAESSHRSTMQGLAISSYNLGCFTGAILVTMYGNLLGRRWTIFLGCTLVSIGAILQCTSFGLAQFMVGRIICGMGTGTNTATVPVWQAETTKPHHRGPILALETSLVIAGVMVSYWIDFGFSYIDPNSAAWRFPIAFQLVFSFFVLGLVIFLPESPRWLILRDRYDEAAQVVSALYDLPPDDPLVVDELGAMRNIRKGDDHTGFKDLLVQGQLKHRTRTLLAVGVQVLSQLSGINIITYYAATIYENEIGLSPFVSRILAACNGTQYFFASLFSVLTVKHLNRRPLLMLCAGGQGITMVILAVLTSIGGTGPGIGAATFLFVFNTFFGIGYAQLSWLYPAEVTPLAIRTQANAVSTSSNWIFNFMVVMITPVAFNNVGWRTYIIFAVFNLSAVPIYFFLFPETRGRALEEIDLIFRDSSTLLQAVKTSFTLEHHYDKDGRMLKSVAQDVGHVDHDKFMSKEPEAQVEHGENLA